VPYARGCGAFHTLGVDGPQSTARSAEWRGGARALRTTDVQTEMARQELAGHPHTTSTGLEPLSTCVVKKYSNDLLLEWRKDRDLVSTASLGRGHIADRLTGFGRAKVVSTLGTGRPKRHFLMTQGPESRS